MAPRRPGSTRRWRRLRAEVLERDGRTCRYCGAPATEVDHKHPEALGGTDALANLLAACQLCNRVKGDAVLRPVPTIALLGHMGSGKTTVAMPFVERTGWTYLSIDEERRLGGDWETLVDRLEACGPAIVESVALVRAYRAALIIRRATIVWVECDEAERQRRLAARGGPAPPRDSRYDLQGAHLVLDGQRPRDSLVAELRSAWPPRGGL